MANPEKGASPMSTEPAETRLRVRDRSRETPRRRLVADRLARWVVSAGGIAIIASILGILIFIVIEVVPLLLPAKVTAVRRVTAPGAGAGAGRIGAMLADEHRTHVATLDEHGIARVVRLDDGKEVYSSDVLAAAVGGSAAKPFLTGMTVPAQSRAFAAATSDGRVLLKKMEFTVTFEGSDRVVTPDMTPPAFLELDPEHHSLGPFAAQIDDQGAAMAAAVMNSGKLAVVRRATEKNEMTGETSEALSRAEIAVPGKVTALVIDPQQHNLYAGTAGGELLWWPLDGAQPGELKVANAGAPVTALNLLLGGKSLAVGQGNGNLSVWFAVRQSDDSQRLERIHEFPRQPGAVRGIAPSQRDKSFLAVSGHQLGLFYSTAGRTLWTGTSPLADATAMFYAPKADGAFIAGTGGEIAELDIHNPHPEVTFGSLFGKVWYEGYSEPQYVWQSSGASNDLEPKLSLVPLMAGTLKGTFYSLLLAIPLGVFGAMYTSQFMHPAYKRYLKPVIEIMASLPSVVLGFLAGLWLAPRIEKAVPALILALIVLPLAILLTGFLWNALPRAFRNRFPVGTEVFLFIVALAAAIWACIGLSRGFEKLAFAGDFQSWLLKATGLGFDQRNAVVVGLAMGFAVIPIIFAIAEDAFSNVPQNLVAGSLALGADRWQTVTRVVFPTASPGIFSAIMIGFGRAVGETMIVLMATGNTPIMSWNPFNGFRTLSANIAVEIPEAPQGGSLYRTLFLAGLLLFVITFIINTVAELVRQRLRERYSQL